MSQIVINYDTVDKSLEVLVDGKKQANVSGVSIYSYGEDESHIEITSMSNDEENGMMERTCLYAKYKKVTKEPIIDMKKLSDNLSKSLRIR